MNDIVFITGNQNKADYLAKWLGMPVGHTKIDLDEIQSLDLREVVEHKARQAYEVVKGPVLVEDVSFALTALGRLPGTFIKWFVEELGNEGIVKLTDGLEHRKAVATLMYAYYDGTEMHIFEGSMAGAIAPEPRGTGGFGFDAIFISDGYDITRAEMDEEAYVATSYRSRAIQKLRAFLQAT